jgi:hypothetical protein
MRELPFFLLFACLLIQPNTVAGFQYQDRIPEPALSLKELLQADKIVYGTILSFQPLRLAGVPALRATLKVESPESFLKGRPTPWPTSNEIVFDLALPTAVLLTRGERVLWFLRETPRGLVSMNQQSGWFVISGDKDWPLASNLNWNRKLWSGAHELWKISEKSADHFQFDVWIRVQKKLATLETDPARENLLNQTADLWIGLASQEKPQTKLPLHLLLSLVEIYLSYLPPPRESSRGGASFKQLNSRFAKKGVLAILIAI